MLDRLELAAALQRISSQLFPDVASTLEAAIAVYRRLAGDPSFMQRAHDAQSSFLIPSWHGNLCDAVTATPAASYTVVAVDGSQVYPDRHVAGAGCFLINIGGVVLAYGESGGVTFFSAPEVCTTAQFFQEHDGAAAGHEMVDLLREARELEGAVARAQSLREQGVDPVILCDGTLIFWMLEGKSPAIKESFLKRYLSSLQWFYEHKVVCAGYISMPKSKELVNIVKLGLCRFSVANCIPCHALYTDFPCKVVDALLDTHLMSRLLREGERSTVFASNSSVVVDYPGPLRPWFFYLHVGEEIARIEVSEWIARDDALLDRLCGVILDQVAKGGGYPVSVAEAHEQAVVKGPDREFFYQLIAHIGREQSRTLVTSQKSIKKRGMRV